MDREAPEPPPDRRISELARRQHGVVGRAQLVALGVSEAAIDGRVKRGRLHRVHQAVYVVGYPTLTRNGRFMAAVLACGEKAALSHFSAAVLWGILEGRSGDPRDGGGQPGLPWRGRAPIATPGRAGAASRDRRDHSGAHACRSRGRCSKEDARAGLDEAEYLRLDWTGATPQRGRSGSGVLASVLTFHEPGTTRTLSELEELFSRSAMSGASLVPR
jgi:hypothetical protein